MSDPAVRRDLRLERRVGPPGRSKMNVALRSRFPPFARSLVMAGVIVALAILTIGSVAGTGITGPTSWQHLAAIRTAGQDRLFVDLWRLEDEAVYVERRGAEVARDERCIAGTLSQWSPTGRTVRELADRRRCYELATDALLGFVRLAQGSGFAPVDNAQGGSGSAAVFEALDAGSHLRTVVIDPIRQVPLRAEFRNGDVWTWEVLAVTTGSPPSPPTEPRRSETYTDLTPDAAAPELGLSAVPMTVAGKPLLALFRYDSGDPGPSDIGPPRVTSFYAIWGEASDLEGTSQIQLVVTDQPPPPDEVGIEELGGAIILRVEENGHQVLVSAPDRDTLELALRVLRPGLKLPQPAG